MPNTIADEHAEFTWPVRVYYEDTDSGGVVYYANYLRYMERARTEWLRALGVEHETLRVESGLQFVIAEVNLRYARPAKLDDQLSVGVKIAGFGRASLTLDQTVRRADGVLCNARVRVACVDVQRFRPCPLPKQIFRRLT